MTTTTTTTTTLKKMLLSCRPIMVSSRHAQNVAEELVGYEEERVGGDLVQEPRGGAFQERLGFF